jgi:arsenate reductase
VGDIPEVLFVCTHNAGRSQMAAALLDHEVAGRVRVTSAGSQPASQLNPAVVATMAEIGLDISREFPKPLTAGKVQAADIVITMGCGDACPLYPGKRYLDWDLPDPAGLPVESVRPIRDEIGRRVLALLADRGNGIWAVLKIAHPDGGFHLESDGGTMVKDLNDRWAQHGGQYPWR